MSSEVTKGSAFWTHGSCQKPTCGSICSSIGSSGGACCGCAIAGVGAGGGGTDELSCCDWTAIGEFRDDCLPPPAGAKTFETTQAYHCWRRVVNQFAHVLPRSCHPRGELCDPRGSDGIAPVR